MTYVQVEKRLLLKISRSKPDTAWKAAVNRHVCRMVYTTRRWSSELAYLLTDDDDDYDGSTMI